MDNSLKLDVRYTHSCIIGVYTTNLILLQLFIKSQAKNNGKELLYKIPTQCKAPFQEYSKNSILSTSFSSCVQEAQIGRKASLGVQGETSRSLLSITVQLTHQYSPCKCQPFLEIQTIAAGHTHVFPSLHLVPLQNILLLNPYTTYCLFGQKINPPAAQGPTCILNCLCGQGCPDLPCSV